MVPPPPTSRRKKWALRLLVAAAVAVTLYLARAPLLRAVGGWLVVDDAPQAGDVVLLLDADRGFDRAADRYRAGLAPGVLVLETPPGRLQRLGVVPSRGETARRALAERDVPVMAVTVVECPGWGDWNRARALRTWLTDNPAARVAVLGDRLNSRRTRGIFRGILGDDLAGRVHWCALPDRRYDETNWWQNKTGLRACCNGYLGLAHGALYGENSRAADEWDPDQYEQLLPHQP